MNKNKNIIETKLTDKSADALVQEIKKINFKQELINVNLLKNEVKYLQNRWQAQRTELKILLGDSYSDWSYFGRYQNIRSDLLKGDEIKQILLKANSYIDEIRTYFLGEKNKIYFVYGVESGRGSKKTIEEYIMTLEDAIKLSSISLDSKTRQIKLRLQPALNKLRTLSIENKIQALNGDYETFLSMKNYVTNVLKESKVGGPIYETYRTYLAQKRALNLKTKQGRNTFEKIYIASKNNIAALRGGDVDNDQIKTVGGTFSLTTTLINELTQLEDIFKNLLKSNSLQNAKKIIKETLLKNKKDLSTQYEKEAYQEAEARLIEMLKELEYK